MSKNYTQLSLGQRYQIEALFKSGFTRKAIAVQIAVHPSTVGRELRRNIPRSGITAGYYIATAAQHKTALRHLQKSKRTVFDYAMKQRVIKRLTVDRWSPELISQIGKQTGECLVSHEWLYHWIWASKHGNKRVNRSYKKLYEYLKHCRRRQKRGNLKDTRGVIPNRVFIGRRPKVVNKRKRLGDIEIDLMMGKNNRGALLVMTDRASLHTRIKKLTGKTSKEVRNTIIKTLSDNRYHIHTLTFDNDKAFADHQQIGNTLNANTYFTRPYTSQDKGTIENRIGVIRRFFPKKTNFAFITSQEVKQVENLLNDRPVRKFNYLTPNQVLHKKIALIS